MLLGGRFFNSEATSAELIFCSRPLIWMVAGDELLMYTFPSGSTKSPGIFSIISIALVLMAAMGSGSTMVLSSSCRIKGLGAVTTTSFRVRLSASITNAKEVRLLVDKTPFLSVLKPIELASSKYCFSLTTLKLATPEVSAILYSFLVESARSANRSVAPMTGLLAASVTRIVMDLVWAKEEVDKKLTRKRQIKKGLNFIMAVNAFTVTQV